MSHLQQQPLGPGSRLLASHSDDTDRLLRRRELQQAEWRAAFTDEACSLRGTDMAIEHHHVHRVQVSEAHSADVAALLQSSS